ncbi:hypothetical protein GCM10028811_19930 [Uliginosibacterium sediminicola]
MRAPRLGLSKVLSCGKDCAIAQNLRKRFRRRSRRTALRKMHYHRESLPLPTEKCASFVLPASAWLPCATVWIR